MNYKSISLFLIMMIPYTQCIGQEIHSDSLKYWYNAFEIFDKFKKGKYEEGCMQFDSLLNATTWTDRTGMLFGGKCCQKCNRDSTILKMFTPANRDVLGDMCRLDWGKDVKADSIYINFCDSNSMITYYEDRKNATNKALSDTLVQFLIEDQGEVLDSDLKSNLSKYGYSNLLNPKLTKNPLERHQRHVTFVKSLLKRFGRIPKKEEVGAYGLDGLKIVMIHSNLENLNYFIPYVKKNTELYAFLIDKRCVAEGRDQIYGTQVQYCEIKSKNLLYPVYNSNNLDLRRFRSGLIPIARYIRIVNVVNPYEICEK